MSIFDYGLFSKKLIKKKHFFLILQFFFVFLGFFAAEKAVKEASKSFRIISLLARFIHTKLDQKPTNVHRFFSTQRKLLKRFES